MTLEGKKYCRDHKIMAKSADKEDIGNEDSLHTFFKSNVPSRDKEITQKGPCCEREIHNKVNLVERVGPSFLDPIMPKHSIMINEHAKKILSLDPSLENIAQPYYYNVLRKLKPKPKTKSFHKSKITYSEKGEENCFSGGSILWFESTTDSDMRQGNFRFWDNLESNVGYKVWKAISNLGIVSKGNNKDYKKKIS